MFLKAVNQKVIASSTMYLKCCCGTIMFKDAQPMVWEIAVILMEEKTIISHYRRQETTSKNDDEYWRFLWELRLVFNKELTQLQELTMGITDIEYQPNTKQEIRDKLESTLQSLLFPECVIQELGEEDEEGA